MPIGLVISILWIYVGSIYFLFSDDKKQFDRLAYYANLSDSENPYKSMDLGTRSILTRFIMFILGYFVAIMIGWLTIILDLFFAFRASDKSYHALPLFFFTTGIETITSGSNRQSTVTVQNQSPEGQMKPLKGTIICTACGTENIDSQFCLECGTQLIIEASDHNKDKAK